MVRSYIEIGESDKALNAAEKALTIMTEQRSLCAPSMGTVSQDTNYSGE